MLSAGDSGNGNLLAAQRATLTRAATVESLSFYVTAASGSLILGIYDATGPNGGPGALKASTKSFIPRTGWNTATVVTPVSLTAGNYWLAYLPSSNGLSFVKTNASGNCAYYGYNFGSLPSKFSASPTSCTPATWSFYATLALPATAVNGACGSSNGADLTSAPTTNLCSAGTGSTVTGSGPWSWSCAGSGGGTTASCSALHKISGACGSANGVAASTAPTANLCSAGKASTVAGSGPWSWSCAGSNGGSTATCSDSLSSSAVSGVCGSANGVAVSSAPTSGLCTTGSASAVSGSGPWNWSCAGSNGGATAKCSDSLKSASSSSSDPTSGLLPSDRDASANWKKAGLQSVGGIPNRTTICTTLSPSGGDDTSAIQTAINACPTGQVVLLKAGTFKINAPNFVKINKSITVRGSGPCAGASGAGSTIPYPSTPSMTSCTLINRTNGAVYGRQTASGNPSPHFVVGSSDQYGNTSLGTAVNLAANATPGAYTVQLASTSGLTAGEIVVIDELGNLGWRPTWVWPGETLWSAPDYRIGVRAQPTCDPGDQGGVCKGGSTPPNINSIFHTLEMGRYIMEIKQIASIGAGPCPGANCTITFNSPVMIDYRTANTAHIVPMLGASGASLTTYAGLENLTMQGADGSSVYVAACAYCWLKNTEDTDYYGYYSWGSTAVISGFRDQLEGIYTHNAAYPAQGGAAYNWSLDGGSSEILIENSISMLADKVMVARGSGAGSAVAYNYADEGLNAGAGGLIETGLNASHWLGSHHVLFEGNWTWGADSDATWGPTPFMTWLRNDVTGFRSTFHDYINNVTISDLNHIPSTNGVHGIAPAIQNYWHSYIGNVVGTPGYMHGWVYENNTQGANAIWNPGYNVNSTHEDPEVWSQQTGASACVTASGDQCPLIRYGNYDYVTNSIADPSSPVGTIPNSFFLSSAPAFFGAGASCTYPWPWVTPTGSSQIQKPTGTGCTANSALPAKARFDAGTPFKQP